MNQEEAQLESSILRAYDRDGMLETLLGIGLAVGGLNLIEEGGAAMGLLPIFLILMARGWRRRITYPRLGYAEVISTRRAQRKRSMLLVVLALLGIAGLALAAELASGGIDDSGSLLAHLHAKLVFGAFVSVILGAVAIVQKAPHVFVAAVLLLVLIVVSDRLGVSGGYALAVTGTLMGALGIARLVLFLRANPPLERGTAHDA